METRLRVGRGAVPGLILLGLAVLVAGCGGSEPEEAQSRESVFDPMVQTIDRAQQVEELSKDRKAALDAALEESEGDERDQR